MDRSTITERIARLLELVEQASTEARELVAEVDRLEGRQERSQNKQGE